MSTLPVKIDFDLIPEHITMSLILDFIHNYERFWADPRNEAEYQQWKAEQSKEGESS